MDTKSRASKLIALIFLYAISACAPQNRTAVMYPYSGPLFDSGFIQPIPAIFTDARRGNGKVQLTLPNGELCVGDWSMVMNTMVSQGFTNYNMNMKGVWTNIYGNDLTIASGGQRPGMATCACSNGTALSVEFIAGGIDGHGFGVGKDNRGNIYRVHF